MYFLLLLFTIQINPKNCILQSFHLWKYLEKTEFKTFPQLEIIISYKLQVYHLRFQTSIIKKFYFVHPSRLLLRKIAYRFLMMNI